MRYVAETNAPGPRTSRGRPELQRPVIAARLRQDADEPTLKNALRGSGQAGWGTRKNEEKAGVTLFARDDSALRDRKKNRTLIIEGCGTHKNDFVNRKKEAGEIPRSGSSLGMTILIGWSLQGDEFAY